MTRSYAATGSRQTAVLSAIAGLHIGVYVLVANGLLPWPFAQPGRDTGPIILIERKPQPPIRERPQLPGAVDGPVVDVTEPDVTLPVFPDADAASTMTSTTASGSGPVVTGRTAPVAVVAPRLRMHGARLAALVNACYPAGARRAGEEGRALVRLVVGDDGSVHAWRLAQGTGFPRLDAAVRCIIERLVIEPGRRDGRAVAAEAELPIAFRLD